MTTLRTESVLKSERSGAVQILTMNRPEKHNALNTDLTVSLLEALRLAERDNEIRAIILAGEGSSFCSGADLSEFKDLTPDNQHKVLERADLTCDLHMQMQKCRKPIIGVAHGNAMGGGAGLAIACDLLIAVEGLRFGYPEMRHSIVPALVMTGLQRHFGRKTAFRIISLGEIFPAEAMLEAGVVNTVVGTHEEGMELAKTWGAALAEKHPLAMGATKELFYRVGDLHFEAAMAAGRDTNAIMRGFRSAQK